MNALSIVSIVLVAVTVAGSVFGGVTVLAIFEVGAGHVALQQIKMRGECGAILAYIAPGIFDLIATYALVSSVYFAIVSIQQRAQSQISDQHWFGLEDYARNVARGRSRRLLRGTGPKPRLRSATRIEPRAVLWLDVERRTTVSV